MAIIISGEKQLLHFLGTEDEAARLNFREFCKRHSIRPIEASAADLRTKISTLLVLAETVFEADSKDAEDEPEFGDFEQKNTELFLLSGFNPQDRDQLLKAMQEEELGKNALKAMATKHNIHWTLGHLLQDVSREHEIVSAYMELRQTLHVTGILIETVGLPPQAKEEFDVRYERGKNIIESGMMPDDPELMRRLTKELKILITMGEDN
ncbi:MAG: DUF3783 domain-containing protein [Fastidiosipilaceae bacterium]|jgi:hypothetical protein